MNEKQMVKDMISNLEDLVSWADYDYKLSDVPGFRDPEDKRYDRAIIEQTSKVIEELNKLLDIL